MTPGCRLPVLSASRQGRVSRRCLPGGVRPARFIGWFGASLPATSGVALEHKEATFWPLLDGFSPLVDFLFRGGAPERGFQGGKPRRGGGNCRAGSRRVADDSRRRVLSFPWGEGSSWAGALRARGPSWAGASRARGPSWAGVPGVKGSAWAGDL